jgi:predicted AAA+ superfamily ATPase
MIRRDIVKITDKYRAGFPVLAFTGARQCGKTTLLREHFKGYSYYNLENFDTQRLFEESPSDFVNVRNSRVIIDEVQRLPGLLPLIQPVVDEQKIMGSYIVSGSENLLLSEKISQSLAGRAAYISLPTFTNAELSAAGIPEPGLHDRMFQGFYPAVYDRNLDPLIYYHEYIATYVERDVRQIKNISNLRLFREFIRLLAGRIGQPFNAASLSNDVGVSAKTIKEWLSVLEASYIVFTLSPYFQNIGKQVTKMPKVYFYDTGLLCCLLDLAGAKELETHYLAGSIFENFIIADIQKELMNRKALDRLFFFREKNENEVDLLIKRGETFIPLEIKKAGNFSRSFTKGLKYWNSLRPQNTVSPVIVYTGETEMAGGSYQLVNWRHVNKILWPNEDEGLFS